MYTNNFLRFLFFLKVEVFYVYFFWTWKLRRTLSTYKDNYKTKSPPENVQIQSFKVRPLSWSKSVHCCNECLACIYTGWVYILNWGEFGVHFVLFFFSFFHFQFLSWFHSFWFEFIFCLFFFLFLVFDCSVDRTKRHKAFVSVKWILVLVLDTGACIERNTAQNCMQRRWVVEDESEAATSLRAKVLHTFRVPIGGENRPGANYERESREEIERTRVKNA